MSTYSPVEAIRAIEPIIRRHADESERATTLARPIVEALREQGIFRATVPAALGGHEVDALDWYRAVEAAARIHGSTGWIVQINGGSPVIGRFMDDETARETFGKGAVFSGGAFPIGRAVAAEGGYVVRGRWPYGSGVKHASDLMALCMVYDGEAPRLRANGTPEVRFFCAPAASARLFDTWQVSGLSGTGSHDFAFEDVFVPEPRALQLSPVSRNSYYDGPLHRIPFMVMFAFPTCAVALGIAQHAIDVLVEMAATKVPAGTQATLKDRSLFQVQLAEATALVSSARAWMHSEVAALWVLASQEVPIDTDRRIAVGLAASNATRSSRKAVELMYEAGGGTANYLSSPLQQCLRDIHAVTQHTATAWATFEQYGAVLAGGPMLNPLLAL